MFGHLASGAAAAAGSGEYTATWVLLSHSGTFEDQTRRGDAPHLPLLRSAAADAKPPGNWKCYHPPGYELSSVLSSVISKGSTVTNFGMTLTVACDVACNATDKRDMFDNIVHDLQKLDGLADKLVDDGLKYKDGGQVVENPIENKTIFMHPMPTDFKSTDKDGNPTERDSRPAAGLSDYFPGLGLYLVEVWDTKTGKPVPKSVLGDLGRYVLGRRCYDNINKINKLNLRPGIHPDLFDTLRKAGLPQYYLDGRFRSASSFAKNHVSDFEIFRGGKTSKDIQQIMAKNCSVMDEYEYDSVMYHYAAGVATKRIALFDLKKVCKLLSPIGTVNFELFDIGCKDPYPNPPVYFSIMTKTWWPPYRYSDDTIGSAESIHTYDGDLNSPTGSPVAYNRPPPRFIGPQALTSRQSALQALQAARFAQQVYHLPGAQPSSLGKRSQSQSQSPPRAHKKGGRGKPHKTRQRQGKRNKSRNFRNKSRVRRTRRRVTKRKNN